MPFADFYEALRAAPGDAREKWVNELAAMPDGPRRRAAVSGFYKLLVQFDPVAAVKAIGEIEDLGLQKLALGAALDAAPGFALPRMAELSLNLQDRIPGKRDYLAEAVEAWAQIDPATAAHFIDERSVAFEGEHLNRYLSTAQVIASWAAVDPKAAKEWADRKEKWDSGEIREFFFEGWYENDPAAAVSYTLDHAEDKEMADAVGAILRRLYSDSKEKAAKFIENLPEKKRPEAFREAFRRFILLEEEDTGDAAFAPRAIATWMTEFPPAYWEGSLGRLFGSDATGAANMLVWIQQLPPSVRDAAASEYWAPSDGSPSEKVSPVLQVPDPQLRDELVRALIKNQSLEVDEATTALNSALISFEQKQHLLQIVAAAKAEKDEEIARLEAAAREEAARAENDHGSEK
jgi:hypothetical protein